MNTAIKRVEQVEIKQTARVLTKTRIVKKKKGLYSFGNLAVATCLGIFIIVVGQLYLDAKINKIHYTTENIKLNIGSQTVMNEELYSKIAELSTYTRAMEIAKKNGLSTYGNTIYIGE
ncbi:MAG: cell division protein FtsL [Turicibacter sp.]